MAEEKFALSDDRLVSSPFYVLRGALFLWEHKMLWKYAVAPLIISVLVLAVSLGFSYYLADHYLLWWLQSLLGSAWYWRILYYLVAAVVILLLLVVFFLIFSILARALAAPFNDLICEKTEELVTGRISEVPFSPVRMIKDISRGVGHSLRLLGIYLGVLLPSLLLMLIPGIGFGFFWGVTALLSSYLLAYEYLGYPMDRRRYSFAQKRAFIRSRLGSALGFGFGNFAVASIPFLNLLLIPAAAVGGTLLFLDLSHNESGHAEQT